MSKREIAEVKEERCEYYSATKNNLHQFTIQLYSIVRQQKVKIEHDISFNIAEALYGRMLFLFSLLGCLFTKIRCSLTAAFIAFFN